MEILIADLIKKGTVEYKNDSGMIPQYEYYEVPKILEALATKYPLSAKAIEFNDDTLGIEIEGKTWKRERLDDFCNEGTLQKEVWDYIYLAWDRPIKNLIDNEYDFSVMI